MAVDRDFSDTPASERHLAIVRTSLWKQDFPSLHDYSDNKTNGRSKNFGPDRKRGSCSTAYSQFSLLSRSERAKLGLSWICKEDIIQASLGRLQLYLRSLLHGVTPTAQLVFHRAFLFLCRWTPFFLVFCCCLFCFSLMEIGDSQRCPEISRFLLCLGKSKQLKKQSIESRASLLQGEFFSPYFVLTVRS